MDTTRIDKYIWAIRLFKTRTDATEACKGGRVTVNGADAKPAKEIKKDDIVAVRKGAVRFTFKVLAPLEKRVGAKEVEKYALNITPEEELSKMHAPVETVLISRDKGSGRPTKKDRRKMDELYESLFSDDDEG